MAKCVGFSGNREKFPRLAGPPTGRFCGEGARFRGPPPGRLGRGDIPTWLGRPGAISHLEDQLRNVYDFQESVIKSPRFSDQPAGRRCGELARVRGASTRPSGSRRATNIHGATGCKFTHRGSSAECVSFSGNAAKSPRFPGPLTARFCMGRGATQDYGAFVLSIGPFGHSENKVAARSFVAPVPFARWFR